MNTKSQFIGESEGPLRPFFRSWSHRLLQWAIRWYTRQHGKSGPTLDVTHRVNTGSIESFDIDNGKQLIRVRITYGPLLEGDYDGE